MNRKALVVILIVAVLGAATSIALLLNWDQLGTPMANGSTSTFTYDPSEYFCFQKWDQMQCEKVNAQGGIDQNAPTFTYDPDRYFCNTVGGQQICVIQ